METLARSLGLVNKHFSEFSAHLHILDLYNVPLAEGECMVKWRFKGSIHLNSATNAAVIKDALDGTKAYLKGKGPAVDSDEDTNEESVSYKKQETGTPPTSPGSHPGIRNSASSPGDNANTSHRKSSGSAAAGLASLKDAILHPKRHNKPRASSAGRESAHVNSNAADNRPGDDDDDFPPNTQGRNPLSMSKSPKPFLSPTFTRGSGDYPFSSMAFPDVSNNSQQDSRNGDTSIHRSPTRKAGTIHSGASPSRSNTVYAPYDSLSRTSTAGGLERSLSVSLDRDEERQRLRTSTSTDLPERTQAKGNTGLVPLCISNHSCHFDQHVICAVQIPLDKASGALQASSVKLSVRHKVRITPLPKSTSAQIAQSLGANQINGSTTASSSSLSLDSHGLPSSSYSSHNRKADANMKHEHEEIHLGDINLDLSEFVSSGLSSKSKDRWVSRRYLLVNGKTNALLRVAVRMDWIGGERTFRAPPLRTGQISLKHKRNGNNINQSTHHHVNSSSNLSSTAHSNASTRSVNTVDSAKVVSSSRARRKAKDKNGGSDQEQENLNNNTGKASEDFDPAAALYSTTDQATIDLIEAIFADSVGYRGSSALLSQKTGLTDRQEAEQLTANAHGEKRGSSGTGAKALRDANIHHDPTKPPHTGYRTPDFHSDHSRHHQHHHHTHNPDQPVLIQIPTAAQAITSTKTFPSSAPGATKTSPVKSKRLMSSNYPSSTSLASRTDTNLSSKAQNPPDSASLLKRPVIRSRTVSSSSIKSLLMKASPNLGSKPTFTPISKQESPEQQIQLTRVPDPGRNISTSTLSAGAVAGDAQPPAIAEPPNSNAGAAPSRKSMDEDRQDADQADSSLINISPDRRSILTTSTRHGSGSSSPVRSKGVRWEDPPAVDKEHIDAILQHVQIKQEEREFARENSLSRTPSTRSPSSSRHPSPERLKVPQSEGQAGSASSSRSNSSEISRVEDLRERGLLPNLTVNGITRRMSDDDG